MSVYKPVIDYQFAQPHKGNKLSNQRVIQGENQSVYVSDGCFMLETLYVATGQTISVVDGRSNTIIGNIAGSHIIDMQYSPLRCDYGIAISGTVGYAKGYIQPGIFPTMQEFK